MVGMILMPYFLSNFSTEAITTDAQSVSGMKPMRTSFFSGASEPAAQAPGCSAEPAAKAAEPLMNCLRSSTHQTLAFEHDRTPEDKNEKGVATAASRPEPESCESDAFARIHRPRHAVVPRTHAEPHAMRVPARSPGSVHSDRGLHAPATDVSCLRLVRRSTAFGTKLSGGGLSRSRASTTRSATCDQALAAVHRQLAQVRVGLLFGQADLLHQDALGALDQLALRQLGLRRSRAGRAARGPARSARSPPAAPAAGAAAAGRRSRRR